MTTKTEKKFPRNAVIDRQQEHTRQLLHLEGEALEAVTGGVVRGGAAIYGLPPTIPTPPRDGDLELSK